MDGTQLKVKAFGQSRAMYRHLPAPLRARAKTLLGHRLDEKVPLRRIAFTQQSPGGFRPALRPFVIEAPTNLYIPKALIKRGLLGYEPYALECFLALLDIAGDGAILDIGANVGVYSLLASAHGRRQVRAFEPTPQIAAAARRSARVSGLSLRVEEVALGDRQETVTLHLSARSDASNSLNPAFRKSAGHVEVTGMTVDAYCARHRLRPRVMKIDTETTEADVLRGARDTLARERPYLLVEALPGRREGDIDEVMHGLDYSAYHLDGPGPRPKAAGVVGKPGGLDMFLLSPHPMTDQFWQRTDAWRAALPSVQQAHDLVHVSRLLLDDAIVG